MKHITLKTISIRNFKGVKELDFSFSGSQDSISGENGTGKTTIFDAFIWLFFGKDSTGRKEFGIIPLTQDNNPIQVDSEVTAIIDEDGHEITLQRVHHQKWVKRRGSTDVAYAGNETKFYYNGVPQKASEYKMKIDAIMDEGVFKLITNLLYFNSIPWQDRRTVLSSMAGEISEDEIVAGMNGKADSLLEVLHQGKSINEYKREVSAKKKKLKDDLIAIPTRIDEINQGIPEAVDEKAIQKQIDEKQAAIDEIDQQIADVNTQTDAEAEQYRSLRESLNNLKDQKDQIYRVRRDELSQATYTEKEEVGKIQLRTAEIERNIASREQQKKFEEESLKADQEIIETARGEWTQENSKELKFDESEFSCPTCQRPYPTEDIEAKKAEMSKSFTENKKRRLSEIDHRGVEIKSRIEKNQEKIKEITGQIVELETSMDEHNKGLSSRPKIETPDVEKDLEGNKDYQDILASIKELEEKLNIPRQAPDISSHREMKNAINVVLDDLKKYLTVNEARQKSLTRINELSDQEKDLAQQLADLEGVEFNINEFVKARTSLIEARINDKFSMVRFKMFKQNINGGEEEACDTLINGVPFIDANNAARVNAGLDIINALSSHYGITAPIFIDNKESVNDLIPSESQLINLVVTKDKELTLN